MSSDSAESLCAERLDAAQIVEIQIRSEKGQGDHGLVEVDTDLLLDARLVANDLAGRYAADRDLAEVVPMAQIAFHEDAGDPALLERLLGLIDTLVLIARHAQIEPAGASESAGPPPAADEPSLQS